MKQSQLECEERIHAIRQKCSITPEECVHDLTFERIVDLIKKLDPKKPHWKLLHQFIIDFLQTIKHSSKHAQITTANRNIYSPSVQPPLVQLNAQNRPSNPTYSVVETINATPQQREQTRATAHPKSRENKMFTGAFQVKIHDLIQESNSKALQAIETNLNKESLGQTRTILNKLKKLGNKQLAKLFPTPRKVELKAVFRPFKHAYFKIKESQKLWTPQKNLTHQNSVGQAVSQIKLKNQKTTVGSSEILASAFGNSNQ
ncbi:Hypothetical_protein [Hexamita inflata]|uniref:Hypothetical_protein n=1 Tax=Hexamita inflata TaxID=28002 RepID=A0AA86UYA2_9EUKA|nr:Hypothetical protein HINF_LOCUS56972 [Hexamita inflata]